jgi:hypothetical protein
MCALAAAAIIPAMNREATTARVVLIADRRDRRTGLPESGAAPVRRFRLARLRREAQSPSAASVLQHLKRA